MSLPTLMVRGKLRPPIDNDVLKRELESLIPIDYIIDWFKSRLNKIGMINRVLVLKSETASGKSTMFPPELFKAFVKKRGIICTQPRIITSMENVNEILKHYSKVLRLGDTIGWSNKESKVKLVNPGLLSATVGTLDQILKTNTDEEIMEKFQFILIDETHERDIPTDATLYRLKSLLLRQINNPMCPFVVLMSATFDPQEFLDYFDISIETNFIWCVGETAGFDEFWSDKMIKNYAEEAALVAEEIVRNNQSDPSAKADILIFLPGKGEFKITEDILNRVNAQLEKENLKVFSLLQIDGAAVKANNLDYKRTMNLPVEEHIITLNGKDIVPSRRVILTTNVAETGLTLDNLKYVIDAGLNRETEFNPIIGVNGLVTKPAQKSRIKQRRGRAGRKFRGVFYPLYSMKTFSMLPDIQFPQIITADISELLLSLVVEQLKLGKEYFSIDEIDMITVPSPDSIAYAIEKLYALGLISILAPKWDDNVIVFMKQELDNKTRLSITKLGMLSSVFTEIPLESVRMILSSYYWKVSTIDIITSAAYLLTDLRNMVDSTNDNRSLDWEEVYKSGMPYLLSSNLLYKVRGYTIDDFIDGLILFNALKVAAGKGQLKTWCTKAKMTYSGCMSFIQNRDNIIDKMITAKMDPFKGNSLLDSSEVDFACIIKKIKHCIYDGYRMNTITLDPVSNKYKMGNGTIVTTPKFFPPSKEFPEFAKILPKIFICKGLSLKTNHKLGNYNIVADKVSIMDSFVNVDNLFLL